MIDATKQETCMEFDRYDFSDPYIDEELARSYKRADARGRMDLLSRIAGRQDKNRKSLPYVLALLAVEDEYVEVREWIARHGRYLDYSDSWSGTRKDPKDNLEERLKLDPDPFVRACLRENSTVFCAGLIPRTAIEDFKNSSHLERLGLMRNPCIDPDLVEMVFAYDDQGLGVTYEERKQLVCAFLTNQSAVSRSYNSSYTYRGEYIHADAQHFSKLWRLISKWPIQKGDNVASAVYVALGAPDSTKAEIYKICKPEHFRWQILENCSLDDIQTLEAAAQDSDENRRGIAEEKLAERKSRREARQSCGTHVTSWRSFRGGV